MLRLLIGHLKNTSSLFRCSLDSLSSICRLAILISYPLLCYWVRIIGDYAKYPLRNCWSDSKFPKDKKGGLFLPCLIWAIFLTIRERTERDAVIGEVLTDQIHCDLSSVHNISSIQSYLVQKNKPPAKKDQLCQRSYQLIPTKFH